jgi:RNA polymerase-binding protein DksA
LFKEVVDTEADLQFIAEDRESELEERAQEERTARLFARLDNRAKRQIEEIDGALQRLAEGRYGTCADCGETIPLARLRALPATRSCVECAGAAEARLSVASSATEVTHAAAVPADLRLLTDRELEASVREQVREDGRTDMEELRIVCRHGVVHLDGAVPSEAEHQVLLKLVTDVLGLNEVVDRLQVKEILWDRDGRSRSTPDDEEAPSRIQPSQTEDVVKSIEEGIDYAPPDRPPPEEE